MTFSIKSNSDIKQHLNIENLTSNGLHSDLLQAGVDAEKLLLRSALVEKSQEVGVFITNLRSVLAKLPVTLDCALIYQG